MSLDFDITESRKNGWVRLALSGELTFASVPILEKRLRELREEKQPVRLNLSQIEFMDSAGLGILIHAVSQSRKAGWKLEIERDLPPSIAARFRYLGIEYLGW